MYKTSDLMYQGLKEFTGLSDSELEERLQRRKMDHKSEWIIFDPKTTSEIQWYYCISSAYLFGNAPHEIPKDVLNEIKPGSVVLDFGGGCGTASLALAMKGCHVLYFDVSIIQTEFVKFMANKYSLDITIAKASNPREMVIYRDLDHVVAFDVLEHVPDYPKYLSQMSSKLRPGGMIYYYAPFGKSEPSHLEDAHGLVGIAHKLGLEPIMSLGIISRLVKK